MSALFYRRLLGPFPCGLILIFSGAFFSIAQMPEAATSPGNAETLALIRNSQRIQTELTQRTQKIQAAVRQIVTEIDLNGLSNMDRNTPLRVVNDLSALNQNQVKALCDDLAKKEAPARLLNVYHRQFAIEEQLKAGAVQLSPREAQHRIPHQVTDLIVRESTNVRRTEKLSITSRPLLPPEAKQILRSDLISAQQSTIEKEIDLLVKVMRLREEESPRDEEFKIGQKTWIAYRETALRENVPSATALTESGPFTHAALRQANVRDDLLILLKISQAQLNIVDRLAETLRLLKKIQARQGTLKNESEKPGADPGSLAERQWGLGEATGVLNQWMKELNEEAATLGEHAQDGMERSADALQQGPDAAGGLPGQKQALQDLEAARKILEKAYESAYRKYRNQNGTRYGHPGLPMEGEGAGSESGRESLENENEENDASGFDPRPPISGGDQAAPGAQVLGALTPKDREAISQYQEEKRPPEYDPLVEQYLKSLSDADPDVAP